MNDQKTVRLVIITLGLVALAAMSGGIVLALDDKSLPGELIALGSVAVGGIASILAKTGGSTEPTPVVGVAGGPVLTSDVAEPALPARARRATKAVKKAAGESGYSDLVTLLVVLVVLLVVLRIFHII